MEWFDLDVGMCTFSRTITPNTPPKWPRSGLKTMDSRFLLGLLNLQTSTPLSIYEITSKESSMNMKFLLKVFMSSGKGWRRNGRLYQSHLYRI